MIIYVDIDNTICETNGCDYTNSSPWKNNIDIINKLYEEGNMIVYWTARGVGSGKDLYDFTKYQLDSWGCKYHELRCDKPVYDTLIDDKTISSVKNFYEKYTNNW
jgi:hypothetical protein